MNKKKYQGFVVVVGELGSPFSMYYLPHHKEHFREDVAKNCVNGNTIVRSRWLDHPVDLETITDLSSSGEADVDGFFEAIAEIND